jgi:hypothetical protein
MKNVTLAIDEHLLEAGRDYARRRRTTLNALIRDLLKRTVDSQYHDIEDLFRFMDDNPPPTIPGGYQFRRTDAYDV